MSEVAWSRCPRIGAGLRVGHGGFTLVELLVVIVVMGILATIVLPRFAQTREKSYDAAAQADLRNAMVAQEAYFADQGTYTSDPGATGLNFNPSPQVTFTILSSGPSEYIMTAKHASSGNSYCVNSIEGVVGTGTTC